MFDAEKLAPLQNLFLSGRWKARFKTISDTTGFNFSVFSKDGTPLFSTEEHPLFCRLLHEDSGSKTKCNDHCGSNIVNANYKEDSLIFKCHAGIMSFTLPMQYMNEKAVILGRGSFPDYDNFREFAKKTDFMNSEKLSIEGPIRFTNESDVKNTCRLVDTSVNHLLKTIQETETLRKKMDALGVMLSRMESKADSMPDSFYKNLLINVSTLLEIKHVALFLLEQNNGDFKRVYDLKMQNKHTDIIQIKRDDPVIEDFINGKAFFSSIDQAASLKDKEQKYTKILYYFPIAVDQKIKAVLGIFDSYLRESDINIVIGLCKQAAVYIEKQRLQQKLHKKLEGFSVISKITKDITSIHNYEVLLRTILDKALELLKSGQGSLMLVDDETEMLYLKANINIPENIAEQLKVRKGEGIAGLVAERGEPILVKDLETDPRLRQKNKDGYKTKSFVSVPLKIGERTIGVLNLSDKKTGDVFNEDDLDLIQSFAAQAAIVLERQAYYKQTEELKTLAHTDHSTGLLNRRSLNSRFEKEMQRSKRHNRPLSVLMGDLDSFKAYNDSLGHLMGDKLLKNISENLLNTVRSIDIIARYGGDEFVIILPETDKRVAVSIAERLRKNVEALNVKTNAAPLTITIGVASYPEDGSTLESLIEKADAALYFGKSRGGNRVGVNF